MVNENLLAIIESQQKEIEELKAKGVVIMTCSGNCDQGRKCDCTKDASIDRATVVVATLLLVCIVSICLGLYKLYNGNAGQDCQIEVQFNDSKATYIGKTV